MITVTLLAVLVTVAVMGVYAQKRIPQMDAREEYREDFFQAANALVDRGETPESVVSLLRFLAGKIGEESSPYVLLYVLLHGDVRRNAREPGEKIKQLHRDIDAMPDDLKEQFGKAVASGAIAISLNSLLVGWLIRRIAMYKIDKTNKRRYDGTDDADILMTGWACT